MKPVIFYIDDEEHNLTVFEASLPEEWDIRVYDNPLSALNDITKLKPWVIISDQRMPKMTGVEFFEITRKIHQDAVRIIVTGYSDESVIIDCVRKAQIFDYIRKPWDTDDLENRIKKAVEYYLSNEQEKQTVVQLKASEELTLAQLKHIEEALTVKAKELARSNYDLEQFAYVASHDLQEPLRKVTSFCQLLKKHYQIKLDEQANTWIDFAVDGAKRMQALIEDLLRFSRVDSRAKPPTIINCQEVINKAIDNLDFAIKESQAVITYDNQLPFITADESQLIQVFQNLIGNAIKFKTSSQPQIHISCQSTDHNWQFAVKDNGIGINKESHDQIFEVFVRLHGKDEYKGTGIGLAICKKIIERHGGKIWVDSTLSLDPGSTFYFTIPIKKAQKEGYLATIKQAS